MLESLCLDCTALLDSRFGWAVGAAALAGLVRGFSGFGAALMFIPLCGILYGPKVAVLALWVIDAVATLPFLPPHLKRAAWTEVGPLLIGSTLLLPFGTWVLAHADPYPLRWAVSAMVIGSTLALASGWRYRSAPTPAVSLAVGGVAGFTNGSVGIGGPPLVLFWLGGRSASTIVRSNIFAYFAITTVITLALYAWYGIFTAPIVVLGIALLLPYAGALFLGDRLFRRSTDAGFRRLALWLCAAAGVMGLPIWS
ncbi:MAG: sulfite exporter TauE/SafE family protein [Acetobacteraceae bacterium]